MTLSICPQLWIMIDPSININTFLFPQWLQNTSFEIQSRHFSLSYVYLLLKLASATTEGKSESNVQYTNCSVAQNILIFTMRNNPFRVNQYCKCTASSFIVSSMCKMLCTCLAASSGMSNSLSCCRNTGFTSCWDSISKIQTCTL